MKIFSRLYDKTLSLAGHKKAEKYLYTLSFLESSFFPIPPDVMLMPMSLARPNKALKFALFTTVASVIGGLFGYFIGFMLFDIITPWLHKFHYWDAYQKAIAWFDIWGIWLVLVAGFSPIPYKIFTIAAGALSLSLLPFVIMSALGRGMRFFLVAYLTATYGIKIEPLIKQYVELIGWITVALLVFVFMWLKFS